MPLTPRLFHTSRITGFLELSKIISFLFAFTPTIPYRGVFNYTCSLFTFTPTNIQYFIPYHVIHTKIYSLTTKSISIFRLPHPNHPTAPQSSYRTPIILPHPHHPATPNRPIPPQPSWNDTIRLYIPYLFIFHVTKLAAPKNPQLFLISHVPWGWKTRSSLPFQISLSKVDAVTILDACHVGIATRSPGQIGRAAEVVAV